MTTSRKPRKSRTVSESDLHFLLAAVHYAESFDGGPLPIEEVNPVILKAARSLGLVGVTFHNGRDRDVELTPDGRVMVWSVLQLAEVDPEDWDAVAEWAQSVSPRIRQFEATVDTWSKMELHALESMVNELRR